MAKKTARDGRTGATYPPVEHGSSYTECEAQPNQRIPSIRGSGNARKEYDAYQGPREEPAGEGGRKPAN